MRWHLNPMLIPTNPEERTKLWMTLLERVKGNLRSGELTDWGICNDSSAGYAFADTDEASLHSSIMKYVPYISFDIKPVLTIDQTIESLKKAAGKNK